MLLIFGVMSLKLTLYKIPLLQAWNIADFKVSYQFVIIIQWLLMGLH